MPQVITLTPKGASHKIVKYATLLVKTNGDKKDHPNNHLQKMYDQYKNFPEKDPNNLLVKMYGEYGDIKDALSNIVERGEMLHTKCDLSSFIIYVFPIAAEDLEKVNRQSVKQFIDTFLKHPEDYIENRSAYIPVSAIEQEQKKDEQQILPPLYRQLMKLRSNLIYAQEYMKGLQSDLENLENQIKSNLQETQEERVTLSSNRKSLRNTLLPIYESLIQNLPIEATNSSSSASINAMLATSSARVSPTHEASNPTPSSPDFSTNPMSYQRFQTRRRTPVNRFYQPNYDPYPDPYCLQRIKDSHDPYSSKRRRSP